MTNYNFKKEVPEFTPTYNEAKEKRKKQLLEVRKRRAKLLAQQKSSHTGS